MLPDRSFALANLPLSSHFFASLRRSLRRCSLLGCSAAAAALLRTVARLPRTCPRLSICAYLPLRPPHTLTRCNDDGGVGRQSIVFEMIGGCRTGCRGVEMMIPCTRMHVILLASACICSHRLLLNCIHTCRHEWPHLARIRSHLPLLGCASLSLFSPEVAAMAALMVAAAVVWWWRVTVIDEAGRACVGGWGSWVGLRAERACVRIMRARACGASPCLHPASMNCIRTHPPRPTVPLEKDDLPTFSLCTVGGGGWVPDSVTATLSAVR